MFEAGVAIRFLTEGKVQTVEAGGRYAAGMAESKIAGARYYYFKLTGKPRHETVDIVVEYFDGGKGSVTLAYDGERSGFWRCPAIELNGGQTWNVVAFRVADGRWTGRCNGCDFRIGNAPKGFAIGAVAVTQPKLLTDK